MHIAEVVTIAKSLPLLRLNTYKSLILSYSADYRRIFRKNMYVFRRKHYDVFTTLIFNPLKTRPDFLLIVKFFLFRDTRKRRGINTHTFTHWLKAKKEERELAFLRTYLCR